MSVKKNAGNMNIAIRTNSNLPSKSLGLITGRTQNPYQMNYNPEMGRSSMKGSLVPREQSADNLQSKRSSTMDQGRDDTSRFIRHSELLTEEDMR